MLFRVELSKTAQKDLSELDPNIKQRIIKKLLEMKPDPFKSSKKLAGHQALFRVRVSDWRIVFTVTGQVVTVQRIGHRREIYDRL